MSTIVAHRRLQWNGYAVRLDGKGAPLVHLVRDERHFNMWRVALANGQLSDMVNLSRARDAAVCLGLALLNGKQRQEAPAHRSPMRAK
jgi:hypothetical protein